jgi:hypothetical protein
MDGSNDAARRPVSTSRIFLPLLALGGLAFAWHATPVLLWHLRFAPALAAEGPRERLFSETRLAPAAAQGDWARLSVGNLRAHLPLATAERARCASCAERCRLALTGGGTFAVFDAPLPEAWTEARDRFAPDAGDISLLRSHEANWRTIDALTDRSRSSVAPPRSFRYEAPGSHGIVTAFRVADVERRVVYVYGAGEAQARVLGVVNAAPETFDRILGSLLVDGSKASGPSGCD